LIPARFSILSTELRVVSIAQACESGTVSKVNDNTKMLRAMKTLRLLKLLKVVRTFEFFGYALSQPANACFEVGRGFLVESASNNIGEKNKFYLVHASFEYQDDKDGQGRAFSFCSSQRKVDSGFLSQSV
jgi:hypothetical protein